jgi:hypothetical protein
MSRWLNRAKWHGELALTKGKSYNSKLCALPEVPTLRFLKNRLFGRGGHDPREPPSFNLVLTCYPITRT